MGTVISKAANGIGGVLGTAFGAPFKTIFNGSCEDVCPGPWDIICFIEHLCVTNLVKLLMILCLCYIILLFCYLLFKVGICQCIARSLCKICWAACETYWDALQDITCFLWHKLKNTKRRNRHHHIRDAELGYSTSSDESDFTDKYRHLSSGRKCYRDRKNWYANGSRHHHHMKLRTREVSFHVKGRSRRLRNSRQLQLIKVRYPRRISKRRRIR
ncbi:Protein HAPLESS 2 [Melia azedarach]|uniref:Protein HAPLESS 2 n=1 Tax=Melia azedarach TaxID=155640 RepID=A0ACC1Y5P9_MELAZ|nr:Protein HAPLESS 2 [Melia azedarach]